MEKECVDRKEGHSRPCAAQELDGKDRKKDPKGMATQRLGSEEKEEK